LSLTTSLYRQWPKQGFAIGDSGDPLQCFWVSHSAGDASQRVELCAISCFGEQEQEDDVNRPIVYGFKIDTFVRPCEEAEGRFEVPQSRVRKRHAVANAGRSKLLAFSDSPATSSAARPDLAAA
jgi:hypothetical protein